MPTNIAIRLGVEGGASLKRELEEAGRSGEQAFKGVGAAAEAAAAAADKLAKKAGEAGDAARRVPGASGGSPAPAAPSTPYPAPSPTTAREVERLRVQLDEEYRRTKQLGTAEVRIGRGVSGGYFDAAEGERLRSLAAAKYAAGGTNDNDPSRRGLSSYDKQFVRYQGFDVASTLGSGGSLTTAAFQQGPQLLQQLADREGGLGAGLKQLGVSALGLVTPITVATTAVGGMAAALAYAAIQAGKDRDVLEKATKGIGAATGATISQLDDLARANMEGGKISGSTAREYVAAYASLGSLALPVIGDLTRLTADYARVTGQEGAAAATELGRAVAEGGTALDGVAAKIGGLDDRTRQLIQTQIEQGDRSGAQATAAEYLKSTIDANTAATTGWAGAWNAATAAANGYWEAAKRIAGIKLGIVPEGAAEAVARLQASVDATNRTRQAMGMDPLNGANSEQARQLATAKVIADQDRMIAEGKAAEERATKASTAAGNVARAVDPNFARLSQLREQQNALRDALADPLARSKLSDTSQVEDAYTATTRAITTMTDATGKAISAEEMARRSDQLRIDGLNAKTAAEKAALAERQKAFDLIGKMVTPSDARGQIDRASFLARAETDAKGGGSKGASGEKLDEYDRATRSLEDRIRRQAEEATTFGQGAQEIARYRAEQDLLAAAKRADRDVTSDLTAQIKDYADRAGEAAKRNEELRDSLRTVDSVRSAGSDSIRSIVTDLQKGTSATNLLTNATSRLATAFGNMASDQIAEAFLGKRGSAGWLSDFLKPSTTGSTESGGIAGFLASAKSFFGFADGGYTGAGMRLEPAGIVHRGEYVIDRTSVDRIGIGTLDAMRKGAHGYADGGYVRPAPVSRAAFGTPASADAMPSVVINNNGAPVQVQSAQMTTDGQGNRRLEMTLGDMVATGAKTPQGRQAVGRQKIVST
ncbi:phage tail length tape measure family protein [Methylobacterium flocculans]|uniref:phage tail length tape measure family protein n=1 Tax=Methylobacterium flocculans TaxID=2984843 RepID=UPI0021F315A5|nr:phage tail length tape measure family protein [Methylobacterium sp. FF17]